MTYTIYIDKSANLKWNWDIIHKADKIGGMIEQVLPELISWHDLKENEIDPALDFIRETWGNITVDLCKEIYYGSCVDTPLEKEIDLSKMETKKRGKKNNMIEVSYECFTANAKYYVNRALSEKVVIICNNGIEIELKKHTKEKSENVKL